MTPAPERPEERLLRMFDEAEAWPTVRKAIHDVLKPEEAAPVPDAGLRDAAQRLVTMWFDGAGPKSGPGRSATYAALVAGHDEEFSEAMWSLRAALSRQAEEA